MLDFSLTDEQEEIRRLARSIAETHLRSQGRAAEKSGAISSVLLQTLAQTGLLTPFPQAYGGSGPLEAMTYTLIAEELGCGDGGLAMNIIGSLMGPLTVVLAGDEMQERHYVLPFCAEQTGSQLQGSLAFAEQIGGYTIADLQMTACLAEGDNQHYILNGTKRQVIHGGTSYLDVVLLRLDGTEGIDGLCAFVLPDGGVEGLCISPELQKIGLHAAPSASYIFSNAIVPATALLGQPGNRGVLRAAALYMLLRAAVACGTARAALEYTSQYAAGRIAFGRPIVSFQSIAFMIAEMAMKLDAARLLLWSVADCWDRDGMPELLLRDAEAAQRQACKIGQLATIDAMQIMGGAGFMQDHPIEMWMRNAAAME